MKNALLRALEIIREKNDRQEEVRQQALKWFEDEQARLPALKEAVKNCTQPFDKYKGMRVVNNSDQLDQHSEVKEEACIYKGQVLLARVSVKMRAAADYEMNRTVDGVRYQEKRGYCLYAEVQGPTISSYHPSVFLEEFANHMTKYL